MEFIVARICLWGSEGGGEAKYVGCFPIPHTYKSMVFSDEFNLFEIDGFFSDAEGFHHWFILFFQGNDDRRHFWVESPLNIHFRREGDGMKMGGVDGNN